MTNGNLICFHKHGEAFNLFFQQTFTEIYKSKYYSMREQRCLSISHFDARRLLSLL
jgi:hypothetical protein